MCDYCPFARPNYVGGCCKNIEQTYGDVLSVALPQPQLTKWALQEMQPILQRRVDGRSFAAPAKRCKKILQPDEPAVEVDAEAPQNAAMTLAANEKGRMAPVYHSFLAGDVSTPRPYERSRTCRIHTS